MKCPSKRDGFVPSDRGDREDTMSKEARGRGKGGGDTHTHTLHRHKASR